MTVLIAAVAAALLARIARGVAARSPRHPRRVEDGDVAMLAELVVLGLGAGLTVGEALDAAAGHVGPVLRSEVGYLLRRSRVVGLPAALESAGGHAGRFYRVAGQAVASGAPLLPALAAFVAEERHAEHTRRQAAARRLPVRLLLPLALLMLPGFVVLIAGPALLGAAERLRL